MDEWTKAILVTMPKKGDLLNCANYRTISMIAHLSKVLLNIMLNRITARSEEFISEEQAGFRANRSTVQQILSLRLIAEKSTARNKKVYNCFVDYRKAFNSVWHGGLWAVMNSYGIDDNLTRLMQAIYTETRSMVIVNGMHSDWFQVTVALVLGDGSRQGDPLSPRAFIMLLERIMDPVRDARQWSQGAGNTNKQPEVCR